MVFKILMLVLVILLFKCPPVLVVMLSSVLRHSKDLVSLRGRSVDEIILFRHTLSAFGLEYPINFYITFKNISSNKPMKLSYILAS